MGYRKIIRSFREDEVIVKFTDIVEFVKKQLDIQVLSKEREEEILEIRLLNPREEALSGRLWRRLQRGTGFSSGPPAKRFL